MKVDTKITYVVYVVSFDETSLYCNKIRKRIQYLVNEFWKRWRHEYLVNLPSGQKWNRHRRNFKIGNIVLLKLKMRNEINGLCRAIGIYVV